MYRKRIIILLSILVQIEIINAQPLLENDKLKFNLNQEGDKYIQMSFVGQIWLRYTDTNPGSQVYDAAVDNIFDIGIRRWRLTWSGQLSDNLYFFSQFGQNNFSYLSKKYSGAFFHDAVIEYSIAKEFLSIGSGLTGWSGLSRYASPSVGSFLGIDGPLYQQTTNSINDQFLRKLSVYAKGKINKIDYRIGLTKPMAVQQSTVPLLPISEIAEFSQMPPKLQTQGYFMYQFFDKESNKTPYFQGSYLGKKRILNIGIGFIYQPQAMWSLNSSSDTLFNSMFHYGMDVFYDCPLLKHDGSALTVYLSYQILDYGSDYIRNIGVMNPSNGSDSNASFNGGGNAFPMIGTGRVIFSQFGYKLKDNLIGKGTIQPYVSLQLANYTILDDKMLMFETGMNWFITGTHNSKLTLNFQNRPIYRYDESSNLKVINHKSMIQLQAQASF